VEEHLPLQGNLGEALPSNHWFSAATKRCH
jgi:hypothetical protein